MLRAQRKTIVGLVMLVVVMAICLVLVSMVASRLGDSGEVANQKQTLQGITGYYQTQTATARALIQTSTAQADDTSSAVSTPAPD